MKRQTVILYWLLLLVPTLLIGTVAALFLFREQQRINQQARSSALNSVQIVADNLTFAVVAAEESIISELIRLDGDNPLTALQEWEKSNPFIRNVFVWDPRTGLRFPPITGSRTVEERLFSARYSALFAGRVPFERTSADDAAPEKPQLSNQQQVIASANQNEGPAQQQSIQPQAAPAAQVARRQAQSDYNDANVANRMAIRNLTKQQNASANWSGKPDRQAASEEVIVRSGWVPWFSEDRLFLLGWVRQGKTRPVYGVEMEIIALLSHLVASMPASAPDGMAYVLMDGTGYPFYQSGTAVIPALARPEFTVPLGPYLPHWQLAAYFVHGGTAEQTGHRFLIFGGLLLFIFVAAIVTGGSLLLWQAHRHELDARQKTSFVSNVSHELKTPLTSIRMYAELLSERRVKDAGKVRDYLGVIVSESQRLTRLVNNVLDFSRLEQGRKKYRLETLDVALHLRSVLDTQVLRINEASMHLEVTAPDAPVTASLDRDAFEQAVLNVVDNAIKYADAGREIRVVLSTSPAPGFTIRIMDRGPGIALSQREPIFDKFHRIDDSLTAAKPGSGLGLTIARRLVRDMGGDLRYEPREDGGSCFVLEFPTLAT